VTGPVGLLVSVALALVCAAVPLAAAHRARNADDRLPREPLVLLVLATLAILLVALSWADSLLLDGFTLDSVSAVAGTIVGLLAFVAYAVLERLVYPLLERSRR
jgi:hypothetical protein